jgi:ABC-2 type transport system permease protein
MKKVLFLAIKDLKVLLSNKGNIFFVLAFPALFALFFGAIYSGTGNEPTGIKIAVVDEDNSEFSNSYISKLESEEALKIIRISRDEAVEQVRKGQIAAAVVLKKGFGDGLEAMFNEDEPKIEIAADPSRKMEGGYLQGLLAKAQFQALNDKFTDRKWMRNQIGLWRDDVKDDNDLDTKQAKLFFDFFDSFDTLLRDVNEENYESGFKGEMLNFAKLDVSREYKGPATSFQITFPQALLWGILMCTATFAISIVQERTKGTFERLRVGPISRAHILAGKGLACFTTCVFITCVLYAGAKIIFKMPVGSIALFVPAVICTLLCFVGLMMFICTLGRTEQSVAGAGWAIIMIMAMLGGGMIPLAFMPTWLRPFSHVSPVKWGIFALEGAIWRKFTPEDMMTPCLILLAFGAAAFLLGVAILRKQEK